MEEEPAFDSNQSRPFTYRLDQSPNTTQRLHRTSSTTSGPTDSLILPRQRLQEMQQGDPDETIADSAEEDNQQLGGQFEIVLESPAGSKTATSDAPLSAKAPIKAARPPWKARPTSASTSAASLSSLNPSDPTINKVLDQSLSKPADSSSLSVPEEQTPAVEGNSQQSNKSKKARAVDDNVQSPPPRKKQRLSQKALARNAKESDDDESFDPSKQVVDARWAGKKKDQTAKAKVAKKAKPTKSKSKGKAPSSTATPSLPKSASPSSQLRKRAVEDSDAEKDTGHEDIVASSALAAAADKKRAPSKSKAATAVQEDSEAPNENAKPKEAQPLSAAAIVPSSDPLGSTTIQQSSGIKRKRPTLEARRTSARSSKAAASPLTTSEPDATKRATRSASRSNAKSSALSPVKRRPGPKSAVLDLSSDDSETEVTAKPAKKRSPPKLQEVTLPKEQQRSLSVAKSSAKSKSTGKGKKKNVIQDSEEEDVVEIEVPEKEKDNAEEGESFAPEVKNAAPSIDKVLPPEPEVVATKVSVPSSKEQKTVNEKQAVPTKETLGTSKAVETQPESQPVKASASKVVTKPKKKSGLAAILDKTGVAGHRNPGLSRRSSVAPLHRNITAPKPKPPIPKSKKRADSDDDGIEFIDPVRAAREKKLRAELGLEDDEEIPIEHRIRLRADYQSD